MSEGQEAALSSFWDKCESTTVNFPGFSDLSTENGDYVQSPSFYCLGHEWSICLYPRGDFSDENTFAVFLKLVAGSTIELYFSFTIKYYTSGVIKALFNNTAGIMYTGKTNFIDRDQALDCLKNDNFSVEIRMMSARSSCFVPRNPSACTTVRELFMDEERADVVFHVGGQCVNSGKRTSKRLKVNAAHATFFAHQIILKKAAPQLAELITSDETPAHIEIHDTAPDTFKALLLYIYGRSIPELDTHISSTMKIIEAADKYGVTNLKLTAEASYVSATNITIENAMDQLLFADSKNLALLKDTVVDFLVKNAIEVVEKNLLGGVPGNLVKDIMAAVARNGRNRGAQKESHESKVQTMTVNELRCEAHRRRLNIDGTREMLIASLLKE